MFQTKLKTAPTELAVSVADLKTHLRIDHADEDTRLETMIKVATSHVEKYTGLKLVEQTWEIFLDRFPQKQKDSWWDGPRQIAISELYSISPEIVLPMGILRSLEAFETFGDDGVPVVQNVNNYILDNVGRRGRIILKSGNSWPNTILRPAMAIRLEVKLGFGAAVDVPDDIKQAILEMCAYLYENRGDEVKATIPTLALGLIEHYRSPQIG